MPERRKTFGCRWDQTKVFLYHKWPLYPSHQARHPGIKVKAWRDWFLRKQVLSLVIKLLSLEPKQKQTTVEWMRAKNIIPRWEEKKIIGKTIFHRTAFSAKRKKGQKSGLMAMVARGFVYFDALPTQLRGKNDKYGMMVNLCYAHFFLCST